MDLAVSTGNTDIKAIHSKLDFFDIDKEISHYLDLTYEWKKINFNPVPFIDQSYYDSVRDG